MLKLVRENENCVVWVESDNSEKTVFGVVNDFHIIDEDGLRYQGSAMDILEDHADIDQDWDNEANIIKLQGGEILTITADGVELS